MSGELLQLENLHKSFTGKTALKGVSFSVKKGSVTGLLGPNGAGKTTLIRIITRITVPDEGSVLYNQQPMAEDDVSRLGYLPEERGLYKKMSVQDQILFFAGLKGMNRKDTLVAMEDWFERLEMKGWNNKKVEELSKGMAQKVQFVCTVIHRPEFLILDEPFTGFDPVNAEMVKKEILRLRDAGTTIMLSTHRMESVETLCDNIILIHQGEKILDGSVKDVRNSHRSNQYHATLEAESYSPAAGIRTIRSQTGDEGLELLLAADEGVKPNDMLSDLMSKGQVHHFSESLPTINDIFISYVSGSK